jgi:lipid-A-disaccharide synthase
MVERPGIVFTAFEPSGDEHAATVIAELRDLLPDTPIWALGGPRMEEAGAQLIERTTDHPAMLTGAVGKVTEQIKLRRRFQKWLDTHPVAVHVPTDSPAANWALCKLVKTRWSPGFVSRSKSQVSSSGSSPQLETRNLKLETAPALGKVVHLIAPQVWAWASWRVKRLRRLSDLVLCVLPFEPAWFAQRGVRAQFIGHPLFGHSLDEEAMRWEAVSYGGGRPKLALLPGSRGGEIAANWPLMLNVCDSLQARYERLEAVVAAADDNCAARIRAITPTLPRHIKLVVGQTNAVLHWADLALPVSGTATLHVARHLKPMAIVYRVNPASWHGVGRWVIDTRTFTLPNLVACNGPERTTEHHVVKEFVPWLAGTDAVNPIVAELSSLIEDPKKRAAQVAALRGVVAAFDGHDAGKEAAAAIAEMAKPALQA